MSKTSGIYKLKQACHPKKRKTRIKMSEIMISVRKHQIKLNVIMNLCFKHVWSVLKKLRLTTS